MSTHLAVAIVAEDTSHALRLARGLPPHVSQVEYRLDMMASPDVALLAARTPRPAIFTCRSVSQGGRFEGPESERRKILRQALATDHFVDIEMDTMAALRADIRNPHRVIVSWHDFTGMPGNWNEMGRKMRTLGAGVAKLVGTARSERDALPPLSWLMEVTGPAIAIAMGPAGVATRLLAPRFSNAFLTFASLATTSAPGQINVREMIDKYGFPRIAGANPLLILFTPAPVSWSEVQRYRRAMERRFSHGRAWLLPLPVTAVSSELLEALRLARVHGAFRLPETPLSSELRQSDFAWLLTQNKSVSYSDFPDPKNIMTFFQGR